MKFKFDANQDFQLEAVNSIVDIFEGQEKASADKIVAGSGLLGIYPNYLSLSQDEILKNVKQIQEHNKIENGDAVEDLDFSVEMETGTGKTYVYLRTIFELNKKYGWKKFIVIVPSVAIREGVIKTLQITKEHFTELYGGVPYSFYEYQSKNISQVKRFADSSNINIMVMTMGAFNRDANVLYSERDQMQGEQPISYIQQTNPILILDEPQNMEGGATKEALKNFNSVFRLRYSATHRNLYNLMYQLTPADAYQMGLVKKIEVYSILDDDTGVSRPYLNLLSVESGGVIKAKVEAFAKNADGSLVKKKISLKNGDDLVDKTNNEIYSGYVVDGLVVDSPEHGTVGKINFRNGVEVLQGEGVGGNREQIMREQIEQTIRIHFEKKEKLKEQNIKVLSLFFIDKVDNYVRSDGFIRRTFIKEFNRLKNEYGAGGLEVAGVHKGYFAKRGDEYLQQERAISENDEAYELIMKDKERLLSFDEPTEFIFSHSALKEGWDNPNIFTICTLRETISPLRKRQEIGRGMRLCVNQNGERVFAKHINLLSVIANESYADYAAQLQNEYEEDGIYKPAPMPSNARRRKTAKLKKDFIKDENFESIWKRISKKTKYSVQVKKQSLIERCAKRIGDLRIAKPQIRVERAGIDIARRGIQTTLLGTQANKLAQTKRAVDCIESIKNETNLTRSTVTEILINSCNTKAFINNPERFCFEAAKAIKEELWKDYIEQISYEVIPETYDVKQFENIPSYSDSMQKVSRSIYDAIIYQSDVEQDFAVKLDADERIKLFIKLPGWFKIATPVGDYNPDWAIVTSKRDLRGRESKEKVYFVIETKGGDNLRSTESQKIAAAKKHFEVIKIDYTKVNSYQEFASLID